ncbi:hypothetical protein EDD15DRAFT_2194498 [Pisolithus albus]|nr:hypothetical protein EDD15DRAFT_2194498 [Pisolithus albus]
MSEPRQRPPSTCVDMTGHMPIRNNHHTPIRTPPDDRWVTHTHASNPATYPGHLTFSPPVTNLSLHHTMRHSSEYQQVDGRTPAFGELPLVHRASAAAMTSLVTTLPYRGHASFQFGGQAKHHDGTSPCPKPFGEEIGSEKKWLAPSNLLVSPSQELVPSYPCGGNVLMPTNPPICRGFHVVNTASAAVPHDLHDSTTGTTSGCVGDYGRMDLVSDQAIGFNLPSSSFSQAAPSHCEPRTYERSLYTGEEDLAAPPGPLVANDAADDAIEHRDGTMDCGWIEPDGKTCNQRIDYNCEGHFATAHGIRNMSRHIKIECCWCPPNAKKVNRKGFIRHLREVHMKYRRSKKEARTPWRKRRRRN